MMEKQTRLRSRGLASSAIAALAVAVTVLFNLVVAQLPERLTQFDLSGSGIYDISPVSQSYLAALPEDVEIHVLADEAGVDSRITRFLAKYADLSPRLTVEYTDPIVFPSILSAYGAEAGAVVVTCAATGRQESFALDDVIGYDLMSYYYYGTKNETDFDAEGLLTSAVDGVLTDAGQTFCQTSGHGETPLNATVIQRLDKVHVKLESVNPLTAGGVPEECTVLFINGPTVDFSADEVGMLSSFLAGGGQIVYSMAALPDGLENLDGFCADRGITAVPGLVGDTQRYYLNNPYLFFPAVDGSVDAAMGLPSDATVLCYNVRGLTLTDPERENLTVSSFLSTSDGGVAVTADGNQAPGTYSLGAVAAETLDDGLTARLTVLGTMSLSDEALADQYPGLSNLNLFLSAALADFDGLNGLSIPAVSLSTPINTVTTGGLWGLLFILILPGTLLICGFARWSRRRKL